ncbi:hypothetical protein AAW51_3817 [Caldimonas brevitalea]|uniref:Uncharacterized protein n=1 Tax=Caldimonas brevitalea TaxID=413882 RepID=A0A0G3BR91_9BURK|nr:hypothetical protein AAW51_3817 [Caldimonas brevitalea]
MVGTQYSAQRPGDRVAPHLSCVVEGGGVLWVDGQSADDWSFGTFDCRGRAVLVLQKITPNANGGKTKQIVDSLLMPRFERRPESQRPSSLQFLVMGECALDGSRDNFFVALGRYGKRNRIDGRTGVQHAWGFDVKQGRIVPLPTERIACDRPDPA